MNKISFYFFWFAAIALMIISCWHEELQFGAIMCGIFAIINKPND